MTVMLFLFLLIVHLLMLCNRSMDDYKQPEKQAQHLVYARGSMKTSFCGVLVFKNMEYART